MNALEMVVAIVITVTIGGIIMRRMGYDDNGNKIADTEADKSRDEKIARLEDRVKVLERIVTDKRTMLDDEINSL